jgi:hypothetical protein
VGYESPSHLLQVGRTAACSALRPERHGSSAPRGGLDRRLAQ